jgi:hypothetical protein
VGNIGSFGLNKIKNAVRRSVGKNDTRKLQKVGTAGRNISADIIVTICPQLRRPLKQGVTQNFEGYLDNSE